MREASRAVSVADAKQNIKRGVVFVLGEIMMKRVTQKMIRLFLLGISCAIISTGCQSMVAVNHRALKPPVAQANLSIQTADLAVNVSDANKVSPFLAGHHLITLFGIPGPSINSAKPIAETVHPMVVEVLEKAGYSVVDVRDKKVANAPVLRGEIRAFWFAGYSYLWPILVQSGTVKYHLVLQQPGGTVLWEKDLSSRSSGVMIFADYGFDGLVQNALTDVLDQVTNQVTSDEFKAAIQKL